MPVSRRFRRLATHRRVSPSCAAPGTMIEPKVITKRARMPLHVGAFRTERTMRSRTMLIGFGILAVVAMSAGVAGAEDKGMPVPYGTGYQPAVTEVAERIQSLSLGLHWVATLITLFVTALLAYTCWRFSEKRNPEARRFSHNTAIEVAWTVIPVIILVAIAWPSIRLLYYQETVPPAQVTVKAIGHQWYWEYMYDIDGEEVYVDSSMVGGSGYMRPTDEAMVAGDEGRGRERRGNSHARRRCGSSMSTAPMVVPVDSASSAVAGDLDRRAARLRRARLRASRVDAVPGRLNEVWFRVKPGRRRQLLRSMFGTVRQGPFLHADHG